MKNIIIQEARNMLLNISKKTLANIVLVSPMLFYLGFSLYFKYKLDVSNIEQIKHELKAINEWRAELEIAKNNNKYDFENYKDEIRSCLLQIIKQNNDYLINEISAQLQFIVKYQEQSKDAVLDRINDWKNERRQIPDSLIIGVRKQ